jgi:hypothetical protein
LCFESHRVVAFDLEREFVARLESEPIPYVLRDREPSFAVRVALSISSHTRTILPMTREGSVFSSDANIHAINK